MPIPSNAIIQDLLMFHETKNIINEGIEAKYKTPLEYLVSVLVTTVLDALDTNKDFSDGVEPISDATKEALQEAGYTIPEATDADRCLIQVMLDLADKNANPTLYAPILMRLLSAYETISNTHLVESATLISTALHNMQARNTASNPPIEPALHPTFVLLMTACETTLVHAVSPPTIPPTQAAVSKPLSALEAVSQLIQNPNDTNRDDYFTRLFSETNVTNETRDAIINEIKKAKKDYPSVLKDLKTRINHYIFSHPEHHASIASILNANTARNNGLLLILCIGQTFFQISNNGENVKALKDFISQTPNTNLVKYGFFAEATPGAAYTPPKSFTPAATPHSG